MPHNQQPIFLHNSPAIICEQILWLVKNSGLNFNIQETPFGLNLSIKKRFVNKWQEKLNVSDTNVNVVSLELLKDLENKNIYITELENSLKAFSDELAKRNEVRDLDTSVSHKLKLCSDEKRTLQTKHEKTCAENKILIQDKETLSKDLNSASVALKSSRKDTKDVAHRYEKKVEALEDKIKVLEQFKSEKDAEQRSFNSKSKKLNKKLKAVTKKEAKVALDNLQRERSKLKANEDETDNQTSEPIAEYSNNNSPTTAKADNSAFAETSENKTENDNTNQNILTKDDIKKMISDWDTNWRKWSKTDNG